MQGKVEQTKTVARGLLVSSERIDAEIFALTGLAMVFNLRVKQGGDSAKLEHLSRTIKAIAGVTCITHASRVIYHGLLN